MAGACPKLSLIRELTFLALITCDNDTYSSAERNALSDTILLRANEQLRVAMDLGSVLVTLASLERGMFSLF